MILTISIGLTFYIAMMLFESGKETGTYRRFVNSDKKTVSLPETLQLISK